VRSTDCIRKLRDTATEIEDSTRNDLWTTDRTMMHMAHTAQVARHTMLSRESPDDTIIEQLRSDQRKAVGILMLVLIMPHSTLTAMLNVSRRRLGVTIDHTSMSARLTPQIIDSRRTQQGLPRSHGWLFGRHYRCSGGSCRVSGTSIRLSLVVSGLRSSFARTEGGTTGDEEDCEALRSLLAIWQRIHDSQQ
jgi:hypothetical protein